MGKEFQKEQLPISELLQLGTTEDKFIELLEGYLNEEDIKILGKKEVAAGKLSECYQYLGVFHFTPATFDINAFLATAGYEMTEEEGNKAFEIGLRIGLIQDESKISPGRVSITQSMAEKLAQFLT